MEVVSWRMFPGGGAGANWDTFSDQWIAQCKPDHGVYGANGWKGTEEGRDDKEEPLLNSRENREPLKEILRRENNCNTDGPFVTYEKRKHSRWESFAYLVKVPRTATLSSLVCFLISLSAGSVVCIAYILQQQQ